MFHRYVVEVAVLVSDMAGYGDTAVLMERRCSRAAKATTEASTQRSAPMPVQLPLSTKTSKKKKQTYILESFHLELRQMADAIIARMFYTGGSPLYCFFSLSSLKFQF
jgi:hypothetical protein